MVDEIVSAAAIERQPRCLANVPQRAARAHRAAAVPVQHEASARRVRQRGRAPRRHPLAVRRVLRELECAAGGVARSPRRLAVQVAAQAAQPRKVGQVCGERERARGARSPRRADRLARAPTRLARQPHRHARGRASRGSCRARRAPPRQDAARRQAARPAHLQCANALRRTRGAGARAPRAPRESNRARQVPRVQPAVASVRALETPWTVVSSRRHQDRDDALGSRDEARSAQVPRVQRGGEHAQATAQQAQECRGGKQC